MATTNFIDGVTPIVSAWLNDADKATYTNKDYGDDIGVVNAYFVNLAVPKAAYVDGTRCDFSTPNANTGAATLNVNGLGAIPIKNQDGVALEIGQIRANTIMSVAYNSATAVFEVLNSSAADATAKAVAAQISAQAGNIAIGGYMDFCGATPPANFILRPLAQTIVPITSYPLLFAVTGVSFGGDGITNFGLPYLPIGHVDIGSADGVIGSLSVGEVIAHSHTNGGPLFTGVNSWAAGAGGFTSNTGSTGGAANLAAGIRCSKCVRYQ